MGLLERLIDLPGSEKVQVGFQLPSDPRIQSLLEAIRAGRAGKLRSLRVLSLCPRNTDYYTRASWAGKIGDSEKATFDGPMTNARSHLVHLLTSLAEAAHAGALKDLRGEFYRARPVESYDTSSVAGTFRSGARFSITLSHACKGPPVSRLMIETDTGEWTFDPDTRNLTGTPGGILETWAAATACDDYSLAPAYFDFQDLLSGRTSRARVSLRDCRMFVRLLSVGSEYPESIYTIESPGASIEQTEDGEVYVIDKIHTAAEICFARCCTLHETGVSWAKPPCIIEFHPPAKAAADKWIAAPSR